MFFLFIGLPVSAVTFSQSGRYIGTWGMVH
jgi:hypothetical protein